MAVINWPDVRIQTKHFDIKHYVKTNELANGSTERKRLAPSKWQARYVTRFLRRHEQGVMQAFLDDLAGGANLFWGIDTRTCRPISVLGGFSGLTIAQTANAFTGQMTLLTAPDIDAGTAQFGGLPVGFQFNAGDKIQIIQNPGQADQLTRLLRVASVAQADAAGVVTVALSMKASLKLFQANDVANIENPSARFILGPVSDEQNQGMVKYSFSAMEVL